VCYSIYFERDRVWIRCHERGSAISGSIAYICGPSRVITWLVRESVVSSYLLKSTDPREWSRDQKLSVLLRNWLKVAFRPGPPVKISFRKVNKQNWQSTEYGGTKRILFLYIVNLCFKLRFEDQEGGPNPIQWSSMNVICEWLTRQRICKICFG